MKNYLKNFFKGLSIIIFYFTFNYLLLYILNLLKINPSKWNELYQVIYLLSVSIFILLVILFIYKKEIKTEFKDFKTNFKTYFKEYKKYWPIMLVLMMLSSILISPFTKNLPQNEELIRTTLQRSLPYLIYICVSASLIAPLTEELVFRKSIKKMVPDNTLFIILSGLVFGFAHVMDSTTPLEYLYILSYSIPGFVFAYVYNKSNNIFVSVSIHFFHNTLLLIIQLLLMNGGIL